MRKSLWSPDEDARLKKYVTQFGHGNWSDVAKYAGLQRCGKSCRLRWLNYLRPDLKRGKFSSDEIRLIVKLHRTLGNSWSKIASCLPGRTDNDIKNFWHSYTRSTRRVILSSSSGSPGDSLRPPADVSNSVVEQPLSDYFSSNVNLHVSRSAASTACHDQDPHRSDNAALQYACSYPSHHPPGAVAASQSLIHGYAEEQQQAQGAHTSCSSTASGSSSTPSPSAVSFRDSTHDAPPPPLLAPHHDPSSRFLSRCSAEGSVKEVGPGACTMASLQHPHFDGGSIYINPSLRPHHQQVPLHYQHDPNPHLLSKSTWDQINEEITDDGLHSVLVNFISHQPLASQYRFT